MAIPVIYNIRSVRVRWTSSIVAIIGIAGAVGVFVAMLALANGFQAALVTSGSPNNAIVMRGGATSEMESAVTLEQVRIFSDAPGVARTKDGAPLVSPEIVVVTALPKKDTGTDANVQFRGVSQRAVDVREVVTVSEGRFFRPGTAELVVGRSAVATVRGVDLGSRPRFGGRDWEVVGVFDAKGSAFESEIWCDSTVLAQTFDRPEAVFQSATVRLASADAFIEFKNALTSDPRLGVGVEIESSYYKKQSRAMTAIISVLGILIAVVMGIGAVFGALNTMYSAVSARAREIATLRALGFGGGSVVLSFVVESVVIALVGGLVGAIGSLAVNGLTVSTLNFQTFSHVAFAFRVTPVLMTYGLAFSFFMGLVGGILPAIRAARLPIVTALREL